MDGLLVRVVPVRGLVRRRGLGHGLGHGLGCGIRCGRQHALGRRLCRLFADRLGRRICGLFADRLGTWRAETDALLFAHLWVCSAVSTTIPMQETVNHSPYAAIQWPFEGAIFGQNGARPGGTRTEAAS